MSLICLIYVSFAAKAMTDDDLLKILDTARTFNTSHDLTGMLLYRNRYFIQALEGEESIVDALYAKIQHDPRHERVFLVIKEPIEQRSFGDWSMGFAHLDKIDDREHPGFTEFLSEPIDEQFFKDKPGRARKMLEAFKEQINY